MDSVPGEVLDLLAGMRARWFSFRFEPHNDHDPCRVCSARTRRNLSVLRMQIESATISVKGKRVSVPSVNIDGSTIIVTGKWLKIAMVQDEEWLQNEPVKDPEEFHCQLKTAAAKGRPLHLLAKTW